MRSLTDKFSWKGDVLMLLGLSQLGIEEILVLFSEKLPFSSKKLKRPSQLGTQPLC